MQYHNLKKTIIAGAAIAAVLTLQLVGCRVDPSFDEKVSVTPAAPVKFFVPEGWPQPVYTFQGNSLTQDGFELGRRLFYDTKLSRDNTVSCGSCHQQFAAFSMLDHPQSHGIDGKFGTRNAPSLFNIAWFPAYFWDGNEPMLNNFPIHPINNPVEMDESVSNIVTKLNSDGDYKKLFKNAFGDEAIGRTGYSRRWHSSRLQ